MYRICFSSQNYVKVQRGGEFEPSAVSLMVYGVIQTIPSILCLGVHMLYGYIARVTFYCKFIMFRKSTKSFPKNLNYRVILKVDFFHLKFFNVWHLIIPEETRDTPEKKLQVSLKQDKQCKKGIFRHFSPFSRDVKKSNCPNIKFEVWKLFGEPPYAEKD